MEGTSGILSRLAPVLSLLITALLFLGANTLLDGCSFSPTGESSTGIDSNEPEARWQRAVKEIKSIHAQFLSDYRDVATDSLGKVIDPGEHRKLIANTLLYGHPRGLDQAILGKWSASLAPWELVLKPYVENPTQPNAQIVNSLIYGCEAYLTGCSISPGSRGADLEELVSQVTADLSGPVDEAQSVLGATWWYSMRRIINGPIQYVTLWLTVIALFLLLFVYRPAIWREKGLVTKEGEIDRFGPSEMVRSTDNIYLQEIDERISSDTPFVALQALRMCSRTYLNQGSVEAATFVLYEEMRSARDRAEDRYEMVRFLSWAIPSVGFIGTIIGISGALGNAHAIVNSQGDILAQQGAIQSITSTLGIAFDTTLVALVLLIPVMYFYHRNLLLDSNVLEEVQTKLEENVLRWFQDDPRSPKDRAMGRPVPEMIDGSDGGD